MRSADQPPATSTGVLEIGDWRVTRGTAGYHRVAQDRGERWCWLTPEGAPLFLQGVHGVRAAEGQGDGALATDSAARLRAWGFNVVGVSAGSAGPEDGLPFMASVEFCEAGPVVTAPGVRLPDVFAPEWKRRAHEHAARRCAPLVECRELLGWVTDERTGWAPTTAGGRPTLLQICLSLEPGLAAYHAAWEFVLAAHGGRLESLGRAWNLPLRNREVVRELTRAETGLVTRGYLRDEARWTREFARRYFTTTAAAIRAADPHHLVLGCRFGGAVGPGVLAECAYPAVDVAMPDWRELPPAGPVGPANPVIAGEVTWTTAEFLKLPVAARVLQLTSVEWMLRRGRTALERLARHPAVVGYVWSQWQDEPGEQPPFARGLVHVNGAEAREHTELLAQFNARASRLRAGASPRIP